MDLGIIEKLAKCIVRPPRAQYKASDLGTTLYYYSSSLLRT